MSSCSADWTTSSQDWLGPEGLTEASWWLSSYCELCHRESTFLRKEKACISVSPPRCFAKLSWTPRCQKYQKQEKRGKETATVKESIASIYFQNCPNKTQFSVGFNVLRSKLKWSAVSITISLNQFIRFFIHSLKLLLIPSLCILRTFTRHCTSREHPHVRSRHLHCDSPWLPGAMEHRSFSLQGCLLLLPLFTLQEHL